MEYEDGLLIRGEVTGLDPGQHGFHVHEAGDVGGNCSAAGNHFSPNNVRPPPFQIRLNINNNRVRLRQVFIGLGPETILAIN